MNRHNRFYTSLFSILLLAFALYAFTFQAVGQTDEPAETSTAVENATAEPTAEPTAEVTPESTSDGSIVISPDGTITIPQETPAEDTSAYEQAFNGLVAIIITLIAAGGGYAIVKALKEPERAKTSINTVLDVLKIAANFTPTPVDNVGLETLRESINKYLDEEIGKRAEQIAHVAVARAVESMGVPKPNPTYPGDPTFLAPDASVPFSEPE